MQHAHNYACCKNMQNNPHTQLYAHLKCRICTILILINNYLRLTTKNRTHTHTKRNKTHMYMNNEIKEIAGTSYIDAAKGNPKMPTVLRIITAL